MPSLLRPLPLVTARKMVTARQTAVASCVAIVFAAASPAQSLTLSQAVESALKNYPSIQVSQEEINAAAAGIQLARTAYLPRVDALAQVNGATRNNVFGMLLPNSTIPSISGPVLNTDRFSPVFGSAVGALVSWEPFDFGARDASVAAASAARTQREATLKRTQFEVASAAADAYVTLVATQELVRAAQAGVDRADVLTRTIGALVNSELRPGADQSRAQAELAAAATQVIQARQAVEVAKANLAKFLNEDAAQVATAPAKLLQAPPKDSTATLNESENPLAVEQSAAIDSVRAQLRILERSYFPRFYLQGSAYTRTTDSTGSNYALGLTVQFPVMDRASIRAKEAQTAAQIRAEQARARQIAVEIKARWNAAVAMLDGARNIAKNTPVQVSAAKAATDQATARYQSGLGTIDAVAEAQRLLTQAEIDDALARLGIWRALLGVATAAGDLQPFLAEVSQ